MEFACLTLSAMCLVNWKSSWKIIPRSVVFGLAEDMWSPALPCNDYPASRLLLNSGCQRRSTMFLLLKSRVVTFFGRGRFIEINKILYRIAEKKDKRKYKETNNREKDEDTWQQ